MMHYSQFVFKEGRKEGFILAHCLRDHSIMMRKALQQEPEAAGHTGSAAQETEREMSAGVQLILFFEFIQNPSLCNGVTYTHHGSSQSTQSRHT